MKKRSPILPDRPHGKLSAAEREAYELLKAENITLENSVADLREALRQSDLAIKELRKQKPGVIQRTQMQTVVKERVVDNLKAEATLFNLYMEEKRGREQDLQAHENSYQSQHAIIQRLRARLKAERKLPKLTPTPNPSKPNEVAK